MPGLKTNHIIIFNQTRTHNRSNSDMIFPYLQQNFRSSSMTAVEKEGSFFANGCSVTPVFRVFQFAKHLLVHWLVCSIKHKKQVKTNMLTANDWKFLHRNSFRQYSVQFIGLVCFTYSFHGTKKPFYRVLFE